MKIMGDVSWINGTKGIEKAQKLWCTKVAINVNWDSTWVVAGWVRLPQDDERIKRVYHLGD